MAGISTIALLIGFLQCGGCALIATCLCSLCCCCWKHKTTSNSRTQHDLDKSDDGKHNTTDSTNMTDISVEYTPDEGANLATSNETPHRRSNRSCSLFDKTKIPMHLIHTSPDCDLCKACITHGKPDNLDNCPDCNISWQEPITLTSTAGNPRTAPSIVHAIGNTSPIQHHK